MEWRRERNRAHRISAIEIISKLGLKFSARVNCVWLRNNVIFCFVGKDRGKVCKKQTKQNDDDDDERKEKPNRFSSEKESIGAHNSDTQSIRSLHTISITSGVYLRSHLMSSFVSSDSFVCFQNTNRVKIGSLCRCQYAVARSTIVKSNNQRRACYLIQQTIWFSSDFVAHILGFCLSKAIKIHSKIGTKAVWVATQCTGTFFNIWNYCRFYGKCLSFIIFLWFNFQVPIDENACEQWQAMLLFFFVCFLLSVCLNLPL